MESYENTKTTERKTVLRCHDERYEEIVEFNEMESGGKLHEPIGERSVLREEDGHDEIETPNMKIGESFCTSAHVIIFLLK